MPKIKKSFASLSPKQWVLASTIIVGIVVGSGVLVSRSEEAEITYETEVATIGTLISSIAATGTVTSGNFTNITTKVSGTVSQVFVDNGDVVQKGQKIAQVTLDEYGKQRQAAAWVTYLEAKETALKGKSNKSGADIEMWKQRQAILDAQEMVDRMNRGEGDAKTGLAYTENERSIIAKNLDQAKLAFEVAQAQYLNADADITSANANIASAYRDYLENAATIIAPEAGVVSDLALAEGLQVSASVTTNTSNGSTIVSAQTVGKLNNPDGQLVATVSLTEVDITSIKANQKATLTLDAYPKIRLPAAS